MVKAKDFSSFHVGVWGIVQRFRGRHTQAPASGKETAKSLARRLVSEPNS